MLYFQAVKFRQPVLPVLEWYIPMNVLLLLLLKTWNLKIVSVFFTCFLEFFCHMHCSLIIALPESATAISTAIYSKFDNKMFTVVL